VVVDPASAAVSGARVEVKSQNTGVSWSAVTDAAGRWSVSGVPSGRLTVTCVVPGFKTYVHSSINQDVNHTTRADIALQVGRSSESVTVTAGATLLKTESGELSRDVKSLGNLSQLPLSNNVTDLQRRVAGVLPIAVNVPRTGTSYRFVRALAVDEETKVTFRYRTRSRDSRLKRTRRRYRYSPITCTWPAPREAKAVPRASENATAGVQARFAA
jgi:hypothetical protein